MMTSLYLGGGGSPEDEAALWREFLRPGRRVVYWPFALEPERYADGLRWLTSSLQAWGVVDVEMWSDLADHPSSELAGVDLVFVGGGNTYALLDHLQRNDFVRPLRDHVRAGGAYYGGSAGAVLAGADIDIAGVLDPNDVGIDDTSGLDLLGGAILRPHYVAGDAVEARGWAARSGRTVLGVPEDAGLVVDAGAVRNVGPGDVAVVGRASHVVLRAGDTHRLGD